MKKKNLKFITFIDEKGPWFIGIGGLLLMIGCAWFQTMGFYYLRVGECLVAVMIGFLAAYFIMLYIGRQMKPNEEAPHKVMSIKMAERMIRNIGIMFLIVAVFTFLATSPAAFLVGLGTMSYAVFSSLIFLVIRKVRKKEQEG